MATTNYPGSLDAYPVPNNGDTISVADHWLGPAVIGIETELGTDPAGSHTNVKDRLDQVDSAMGFKNRIIGGNFSTNPWQRGTSFTGVTAEYTADRFVAGGSQDGSVDILKTADAPTIAEAGVFTQHCLHADVTSADTSIGASQYYEFYQFIEGYNILDLGFGQSGTRYFTLSFWHKHTKTGTHCISIRNGAVDRSYVVEYTQSVSDTWEKEEITIPVDTTGTYDYTNQRALQVVFTIAAGTDRHTTANAWQAGAFTATSNQVNNLDSTSNNFKIALVQLEAGDKATRFETRSVGQELALCQRYYYRAIADGSINDYAPLSHGRYTATNIVQSYFKFPVTMRYPPSSIESANVVANDLGLNAYSLTSILLNETAYDGATIVGSTTSGVTAGYATTLYTNSTNYGYVAFNSEL